MPKIGDIVNYRILPDRGDDPGLWRSGSVELPAIVVRIWSEECVNLQVFADGPAGLVWRTSVLEGNEPGQWYKPQYRQVTMLDILADPGEPGHPED